MPSPRQTQSFLRQRFADAGIRPHTHLGQNFLIDLNLLRLLVESADLGPDDVVLEVGTGTGSLTAMAARQAAAVVTVELDSHLFQLAAAELMDFDNVTMLRQDALKNKNTLHPAVLDAVRARLAERPGLQFKLLANLPYSVATPILTNLLACDVVPRTMTATLQKELADRITARPSTKDYAALAIWVQSQCRVEIVRVMPPEAFWPRPQVHSAIVHLAVDDELRGRIPDLAFFHGFVRSLFLHRRKFLRGVLVAAFKDRFSKSDVDALMAAEGLGETARAEELDVGRILSLAEAVREKVSDS